jgi:hypothetical protein
VTTFTHKLNLSAACLVLLATTVFCQEPQRPLRLGDAVTQPTAKRSATEDTQRLETADDRNTTRPLNMLVLGDSILWGQGLKTENKPSHHVKLWLEMQTGRPVIERIEAHSGAMIESTLATADCTSTNPEVNLALPTLHDEIDRALRFYGDGSRVDLVLVSGCANDTYVQNLLTASNTEEVDEMTDAKCGIPMENLLRRIIASFPAAQVIVTGYYPSFSEDTRSDFIVKALARSFFKSQREGTQKITSKEALDRIKINSKRWYEASNKTLAEAVGKTNAEVITTILKSTFGAKIATTVP